MNRTNAEIDALVIAQMPLIYNVARSVAAHLADDLANDIVVLWYARYRKNPAKWWGKLADEDSNHVAADVRQLAYRVLEHWARYDRELELDSDTAYTPVEWGNSDEKLRYENGIGEYMEGAYVATDADVQRLFEHVARHNMVDADSNGLGRVEAADLMSLFINAAPKTRHTIRLIASGYDYRAINNSHAYQKATNALRAVL